MGSQAAEVGISDWMVTGESRPWQEGERYDGDAIDLIGFLETSSLPLHYLGIQNIMNVAPASHDRLICLLSSTIVGHACASIPLKDQCFQRGSVWTPLRRVFKRDPIPKFASMHRIYLEKSPETNIFHLVRLSARALLCASSQVEIVACGIRWSF